MFLNEYRVMFMTKTKVRAYLFLASTLEAVREVADEIGERHDWEVLEIKEL